MRGRAAHPSFPLFARARAAAVDSAVDAGVFSEEVHGYGRGSRKVTRMIRARMMPAAIERMTAGQPSRVMGMMFLGKGVDEEKEDEPERHSGEPCWGVGYCEREEG